ncbi:MULTISPECIES: GNAT family N-acetyltransferase [Mammaliicoccus]|uniref:GNAT family N-acetyltransferase n=1 Tax=Mammaliicoccus sciuri TaxID=1296 RepID=A0AAJ4VGL6_MAMSC|nr:MULTISPECIES: GNAT family N-acetyltransferase [Mammaliicoccus]MBF9298754.1 GNAT family N-acetyltransferase [Staphylococcus schleiferi]MCJ0914285.1 GNAT family N-acetyltransferase [Mammaliicoccus sciuri]MCJ0941659.1 GNAT family N-acetyltransferase [Mammaliicoccus sciuri]MDL0111735.1 GNAT family N-acetyltransferase [Mammaliicoccus sciuri]MDL0117951.1 GNAT family N-acetyltransferase [Mammaliicoccus sciuri]
MSLLKTELQEKDYPLALKIWERSVLATHHFLKEEDRIALKKEIPTYFKYVDANLWLYDGEAVGFSGINEDNLEMLFIDPEHFRKGFGTEILKHLLKEDHIQKVDVNKDNEQALNFYMKNGFKPYKESSHDGQGRDYPIIHLKL